MEDGNLILGKRTALSTFFYSMVEKGMPKKKPQGDRITLLLPQQDCHGGLFDGRSEGVHINETNVARVNEFLDFVFRKEMFARLDLLDERGEADRKTGKMKEDITLFLQQFDITEADLSYETVYKSYYRFKKSGRILIEKVL